MTVIKKLKEWVLAWIWIWVWFVLVGGIAWIAYASYSWVTQSEVTSWDTLSASSWNDMLNNQNFLKQEVENIDTTWFVTKAWDTMGGELSMGTNKITSLWTPTATTDAVTKAYVDSLTVANPATEAYVDSKTSLNVAKAWDTMWGNLSMWNNKITNLAAPTATTDATNKAYVDSVSASGEWQYQVSCTGIWTLIVICIRINTITGVSQCRKSTNGGGDRNNCNYAPW